MAGTNGNGSRTTAVIVTAIVTMIVTLAVSGLLWGGSQNEKLARLQSEFDQHSIWSLDKNEKLSKVEKESAVISTKLDNVIEELKKINLKLDDRDRRSK